MGDTAEDPVHLHSSDDATTFAWYSAFGLAASNCGPPHAVAPICEPFLS